MKLRYSPTSPFVRKVTITAIETGLDGRIEHVPTNPWDAETDLGESNPLGKVPTLTTDDGMVLYDSAIICEYLDSLHSGPKLFPASGTARFDVLRRLALVDGITDAGVLLLIESRRRPEDKRWDYWLDRQRTVIERGFDQLDQEAGKLKGTDIDISQVAGVAAIGWFEFRDLIGDWRKGRDALAAWYDGMMQRPSCQQTVPTER